MTEYRSAADPPDEDALRKPSDGEFTAAELQKMRFPPIAWVVRPYIAEGVTILAGKPKLGKSWLALDMAIAVARGGFVMGEIQCGQGDVLYLALEDNQRRLQGRVRKLIGDVEWPPRLSFRTEIKRLADGGTDVIRNWCSGVANPRLVIIDVLASVRSSRKNQESPYEGDYAALQDLKGIADEFSIAILVIHHLRKMDADSDPFDAVSGTTGLTGAADTTLVLKSGTQGVTLYGRGRDVTEVEHAVTFEVTNCRWKVLGDAGDVRRTDERRLIIEALEEDGGEMSPQEIARVTGSNCGAIRRLLGKMVTDREVVKAKRGKYAHPSNTGNNGNKVTNRAYDA